MKLLLTLIFLSLVSAQSWADDKQYIREYTYVAGEADSKISARQLAMQEVKLELLNEIGVHIYSRMDLTVYSHNEAAAKHNIRAITSGIVKIEVLEEKWDGYTYYIKAMLTADPDTVARQIETLAKNDTEKDRLKEQLINTDTKLSALKTEMLAINKALQDSKSEQTTRMLAIEFTQKSNQLSVIDLYERGMEHYRGYKGSKVDLPEAFVWFYKAANLNHQESQSHVGYMLSNGIGVAQDIDQGRGWYQRAAAQGDTSAQHSLFSRYLDSHNAKRNSAVAITWLKEWAGKGYAVAQEDLFWAYWGSRGGLKFDKNVALGWLTRSAKQGLVSAQHNLGAMYGSGFGFDDLQEAVYWTRAAAENGSARDQYQLAGYYKTSIWDSTSTTDHIKRDDSKALMWYEKAAEQGHAKAQLALADMLYVGQGIKRDFSTAFIWYKKAAKKGEEQAQLKIADMYAQGAGIKRDYAKSVYWYRVVLLTSIERTMEGAKKAEAASDEKIDKNSLLYSVRKSTIFEYESSLYALFSNPYLQGDKDKYDYERAAAWFHDERTKFEKESL
ncbi:MAG: tetratricopeptide repeat protein [Cycloclasticus sp.]